MPIIGGRGDSINNMPTVSAGTVEDDCEWIVQRAKEKLEQNDKYGAHAWILTAKSLFPYRFIVQYEAFKLYFSCNELQDAAQTLVELCNRFKDEEQLQLLIEQLVNEIQLSHTQQETMGDFQLKKVFDLLNSSSQKMVLIGTADKITDVLRKAKITIVLLKLFPETATTLGLDLYDLLSQMSTKSTNLPAVDNPHREILVTELIPLLAASPRIIIDQPILRSSGQSLVLKTSHICQWLEMAASFFTTVTVDALINNKKHAFAGKSSWECLHKIFLTVANKCNWVEIIHSKQIGPHLPSKVRWIGLEHISGFNSSLRVPFEAPRSVAIACFYISVFLFFESAWHYYSHIHQVSDDGVTRCWALIEEHNISDAKKPKETKATSHPVMNLQTGTKPPDPSVVENFVVAIDCWNFLHSSNTYRGEFTRLCQQWGTSEWSWLVSFKADMELYKGDIESFRKVLQRERQKMKSGDKEKLESMRILLQLVNAYLLLGDTKSACNLATELIALVPDTSSEGYNQYTKSDQLTMRSLCLIGCSANDILPYTLDIITASVKDIVFSDSTTDAAIGQLIVLCQYKWPKDIDTFMTLILLIQKRGSFSYTKFFDYIINIEILEEIMYLVNQGTVKMNLINIESTSRSGRAVTRGANNKVKEDIATAMEKQLLRCNEPIDGVLKTFFKHEKLCFVGTSDNE